MVPWPPFFCRLRRMHMIQTHAFSTPHIQAGSLTRPSCSAFVASPLPYAMQDLAHRLFKRASCHRDVCLYSQPRRKARHLYSSHSFVSFCFSSFLFPFFFFFLFFFPFFSLSFSYCFFHAAHMTRGRASKHAHASFSLRWDPSQGNQPMMSCFFRHVHRHRLPLCRLMVR